MRRAVFISLIVATAPFASAAPTTCSVAVPCPTCTAPLFAAVAGHTVTPEQRAVAQTEVGAGSVRVLGDEQYRLEGEVVVNRADQWLWSERLDYNATEGTMQSPGPMRFQNEGLLASAETAIWHEEGASELTGMQFQLRDGRGNGRADKATLEADGKTRLTTAAFTSCDPADPDWQLTAGRIDLDQESGVGRARQVALRLGDVPVLYLPYARFPIDDRRQSGLLIPTLGSSNDAGYDLIVPYYLNLAPNYDATISPRLIRDRGAMLGGEFRYLGASQHGEIDIAWLDSDDRTGDTRSAFDWIHQGQLGRHWFVDASLHDVSDQRYFEDFGESLTSVATSLLPSYAYLRGRGAWWNASVGGDRQQVTDPRLTPDVEPYRRLPRAQFELLSPNLVGPQFGLLSEWVRFRKDDALNGDRLDLHPSLIWPLESAAGFLRPQLGYRYTRYDLERPTESSPSRGLGIASLDAGLFFERALQFGGGGWTQTLEPRLYALYVPYEDQSDLPVFDTQELTYSFASLFRDNRYTGADRQTDARQATLALTSRVVDGSGRDRLRLSLGQVHYFDPPRVVLPGQMPEDRSGSDWAAEVEWLVNDQLSFSLGGQWDAHDDRTELGYAATTWRYSDRGLARLAYRYRRGQLEQVDVAGLVPLSPNWRLIARWNQSLVDDQLLEAFGGLEYESCCYAVRVLARRYVRNFEGDLNNGIMLELELKGLGSLGRRTEDFLSRAMLGIR
ncbi:MAG: LPS assembly protein LptD [Xanthomonadales bacterium]|nr:LPS assembly protein LptD [Xanthomonadales bacterium]MBP6079182.1 LPS assembly protein LptD [Xanthomonadales bacterium]MBP7622381.1 LPS assembly protein LptD [Xanthomonadales bacterium]